MLWSALVAGACGAVAALIAKLFVRDVRSDRGAYTVVMLIAFAALNASARALVMPRITAWEMRTEARRLLHENRVYSLLVSEHPEVGQQLENMMVEAARNGDSADVAFARGLAWGRNMLGPYFLLYTPHASDESLTSYMSTLVAILDELNTKDKRGCYSLLYGQTSEGGGALAGIANDESQKLMEAMADVIESAMKNPHAPPEVREAEILKEDLIQRLRSTHGQEFIASLPALADPLSPKVDRAQVCIVVTEVYREVLKMPEEKRGSLLRYMLATKTK